MKRFFPVKPSLSEAEVEQGLNTVIKDGVTTQIMITLIGGAFLTDYALKLGASNLVIGFITAITVLANLIQVPSIYLVEKFRNRRALTVSVVIVSRTALLGLAFIPLLSPHAWGIPLMLFFLLIYAILAATGTCSWNSWMKDLVPLKRLGTFFAKRMVIGTLVGVCFSLAAGFGIDYWKSHHADHLLYGYAFISLVGALAGLLGVYFISQIPEPEMVPIKESPAAYKNILIPFQDHNFKNLIWFLGPWNFAINLAVPFFNVYMLKYLNLSLSTVILLTLAQQISYITFMGLWGRVTDRFSNKTVLTVCSPLYLICIFGWTFTTMPGPWSLTLPLLIVLHVLQGIAASGIALTSNNFGLKLAPRGTATTYLAAISIVNSLSAGLAPILAGSSVDFMDQKELVLNLQWLSSGHAWSLRTLDFQHWDFFFVMAGVIGLYSLHRLSLVKEEGETSKDVLWQGILSELKQHGNQIYYSLGLLFLVFHWPFAAANNLLKRSIKVRSLPKAKRRVAK